MYSIEDKGDCSIYTFNGIDLKLKSVEKKDEVFVFIEYKGKDPLLSMLFGDFGAECELDNIDFEVRTEGGIRYAVVSKDHLTGFIKEVYFFVMENKNVLDKIV